MLQLRKFIFRFVQILGIASAVYVFLIRDGDLEAYAIPAVFIFLSLVITIIEVLKHRKTRLITCKKGKKQN